MFFIKFYVTLCLLNDVKGKSILGSIAHSLFRAKTLALYPMNAVLNTYLPMYLPVNKTVLSMR